MDKVPTEEELIEHILTAHLEEIAAAAEKYVNKPPKDFTAMLWNPVIDRWNRTWENECVFHARLYDIHGRVVEPSPYSSRDFILELAERRFYEHPDRYRR